MWPEFKFWNRVHVPYLELLDNNLVYMADVQHATNTQVEHNAKCLLPSLQVELWILKRVLRKGTVCSPYCLFNQSRNPMTVGFKQLQAFHSNK